MASTKRQNWQMISAVLTIIASFFVSGLYENYNVLLLLIVFGVGAYYVSGYIISAIKGKNWGRQVYSNSGNTSAGQTVVLTIIVILFMVFAMMSHLISGNDSLLWIGGVTFAIFFISSFFKKR